MMSELKRIVTNLQFCTERIELNKSQCIDAEFKIYLITAEQNMKNAAELIEQFIELEKRKRNF